MTTIAFDDAQHYDFAVQFLNRPGDPFGAHVYPRENTIDVAHPIVAQLLQRMRNGQGVVLPFVGGAQDAWMIVAPSRRELDVTLLRVSRFIVPTYAAFANGSAASYLKAFTPDGNALQQLGASLYPTGYYSLRSPKAYRNHILAHLGTWLTLEEQRPAIHFHRPQGYRDVYDRFETAIAARDWAEAHACVQDMRLYNLSTADNIAFLEVQLLFQQQQWFAIWQRPDFATLATLRVPRAVRAALLTSFHHTALLPLEQEGRWDAALARFEQNRPRLGLLLTGRFDLAMEPIVRVFAYEAAFTGDRELLHQLRTLPNSTETTRCLDFAEGLLPAAEVLPPPETATQRVRRALADQDYDTAIHAALAMEDGLERSLLLMEIAFHSGDQDAAHRALVAFRGLPLEAQAETQRSDLRVSLYLKYLEELTGSTDVPEIADWLTWFARATADPGDPELTRAIDRLKATIDERYWTAPRVAELTQALLTFVLAPDTRARSYARSVVQYFVALFLNDSRFPRSEDYYAELYETLYLALFERRDVNVTTSLALLRLAEARLRRSPAAREAIWKACREWFDSPVPAFEGCVLESFDLLAEYGLPGGLLADWYRQWVEYLLGLPTGRDRVSLESWLAYGEWIQPGGNLLQRVRRALESAVEKDSDNPVAALPAGYRIAIFTLRPASAERARQAILARNGHLDVRVCTEENLNEQTKALAQNSQMTVIVTTCITHALTYGIGPYLPSEPVYPVSSGSTSIVRAIEEQARKIGATAFASPQ